MHVFIMIMLMVLDKIIDICFRKDIKIKNDTSIIIDYNMESYSKKTRDELLLICKENKIKTYSKMKKKEIIDLIKNKLSTPIDDEINVSEIINNTNVETIKFIDLFAGTGAFTLVFESITKFQCVYTNDMMKCSKDIYNLNFPSHTFCLDDLNKINVNDIPNHKILCGGFPCQPFSIAGKQKGFDDLRSNVFWKILEILEKHSPEIILLENVKNLTSHDDGKTFKVIEEKLKSLGYNIKSAILDTDKITNIPQHRERIYIVGFKDVKKSEMFNFDFPSVQKGKISDFLESDVDDKYYYTNRFKVFDKINTEVVKNISENILYQYRRFYIRENKNNCCPTLTANMGGGGHNIPLLRDNKGVRKLTPRECFNLQGFPKDYKLPDISDSSLYKLAGNAVSVPFVELIVNKLNSII